MAGCEGPGKTGVFVDLKGGIVRFSVRMRRFSGLVGGFFWGGTKHLRFGALLESVSLSRLDSWTVRR